MIPCCAVVPVLHPQCAGDAKDDGDYCGAWTCHQCHLVPAQIRQLEKTISQISRDVQSIKQVQSSHSKMQKSLDEAQLNNQQLVSQLAIKTADSQVLKGELDILQDRVELLQCTSAPDSPVIVNNSSAVPAPSPAPFLFSSLSSETSSSSSSPPPCTTPPPVTPAMSCGTLLPPAVARCDGSV